MRKKGSFMLDTERTIATRYIERKKKMKRNQSVEHGFDIEKLRFNIKIIDYKWVSFD